MNYNYKYKTPNGFEDIILYSDGEYLTGLLFQSENNELKGETKKLKIFDDTIKWLDIYFSGKNPNFIPKIKHNNLTDFRKMVYDITIEIPYGSVITYGDISKRIASIKGIKRMSSQAVGNALHVNQICLIMPCHRVIGTNNNLTGYGGGINNKIKLLELEGNNIHKYNYKGNKI